MKVLDLFAGTKSATRAFYDNGHEVVSVDIDDSFRGITHYVDIKALAKNPKDVLGTWMPDVIWASPPCNAFSMAGGRTKDKWWSANDDFYGPRIPKNTVSREGTANVLAALHIIKLLSPKFWWLENPLGGLRTMGFMREVPGPVMITYCQYGDTNMKATDLWGVWPKSWVPRTHCWVNDPCHLRAPRKSKGALQKKRLHTRAVVPYELSQEICVACEGELID